jgi:hypothetical protein
MQDRDSTGQYRTFFVDGQVGKTYGSVDDLINAEGFSRDSFANITRLDNATPNFKHMAEDSVCRVSYTNPDMNRIYNQNDDYMYKTGTRWTG